MPTARLIRNDEDFRVELSETAQGYQGIRHYLVDTSDEVQALTATGLPQIGDPWDTLAMPSVIAMERGPIRPYTHHQQAGWCIVPITYRSFFFYGSFDYVPSPGFRFTELDWIQDRVTEYFAKEPIGALTPPGTTAVERGAPIANGRGAPKNLGRLSIKVHRFYLSSTLNGQLDVYRMMQLVGEEPKTNSGAVTLPPLFQSNLALTFARGELLMVGVDIRQQGRMSEVIYTMNASPNHLYQYVLEDKDGKGGNVVYSARLYDEASFAGLW